MDDKDLIAIDWEHSERRKNRLKYLDEAYIFQNLLQNHDEETAMMFLEKFLKSQDFETNKDEISAAILKKLYR
jgi:hypothetical protein